MFRRLNALNIRLDAPSIAFQLDHGGAKIILVDPEFSTVIDEALKLMSGSKPFVFDVDDATYAGGQRIGEIEYEAALALGNPSFAPRYPDDEWNAIALSYTSGTTGNPKGVVTHHRDAYLNAVSNILATGLVQRPAQSSLKKQGIGTTESTMNGNTDVELSAEFLQTIRYTSGRCRCSIATAGASPGRWPPLPASMSACARSVQLRSLS
jgi:acyl-CoA synthetase (AMP-forming)/AMP-acid ligase II